MVHGVVIYDMMWEIQSFDLKSYLPPCHLTVVVRGKINAALSLPLDEIPKSEKLAALLAIPHLNFFHVQDIVDVLGLTV